MGHLLVGIGAVVREDAVTGLDRAQIARDLTGGAEETGDLLRRGVLREIVERDISALGNDQYVGRGLGVDVAEGEGKVVLSR